MRAAMAQATVGDDQYGEDPTTNRLQEPVAQFPGKPAPDFAAQQISGTYPARLKELTGKVVILDFWGTWCGPCAMTMPQLDAWQSKYGARGLRIIGVSNEDESELKAYVAQHKIAYTIARDGDDTIAHAYQRQGFPMLVIIDRRGTVRHVQLGIDRFGALESEISELLKAGAGPSRSRR